MWPLQLERMIKFLFFQVTTYYYQRHEPENTTLYKLIQVNWLSFQQQVEHDLGYPLPDFVNKEFESYLRCGILAHGFLRASQTAELISSLALNLDFEKRNPNRQSRSKKLITSLFGNFSLLGSCDKISMKTVK